MPFSLGILWSRFDKKYSNFLWGFSFIFFSHYWLLYLHPLTWMGFSWISSLFISTTILFSCSLLGGLLVLFWGVIGQKVFFKKYIFYQNYYEVFINILFLSFLWAFGELLLSQTPFFWIGVSESLIPGDLYLAGLSRWIGSTGICIIQMMIGFWVFFVYVKWKRNLEFRKLLGVGIIIIFFLHIVGALLILPNGNNSDYPIAIWQTNNPTREKIFLNNKQLNQEVFFQQNKALANNAELLVAPEGTFNVDFNFENPSKINTLVGGFRKYNNQLRSSLLAFKKGETNYSGFLDKYRLVPLGEKVPKFLNKFSKGLSSVGGIQPGLKSRYFKWGNTKKLAIAICYEISDGLKIREAVKNGSEIILSIANLDPYPNKIHDQFISLATIRSIENNRDTIIVSNTGPSGLIRNNGRLDKFLKPNIEESIVVYPNTNNQNTFYNKYGILPLIFSFLFILTIKIFQRTK